MELTQGDIVMDERVRKILNVTSGRQKRAVVRNRNIRWITNGRPEIPYSIERSSGNLCPCGSSAWCPCHYLTFLCNTEKTFNNASYLSKRIFHTKSYLLSLRISAAFHILIYDHTSLNGLEESVKHSRSQIKIIIHYFRGYLLGYQEPFNRSVHLPY